MSTASNNKVSFGEDPEPLPSVKARVKETFAMYLKYHHEKSENTDEVSKKLGISNEEDDNPFPMFRHVEKTGVIFATAMAKERGFHPEDPSWANMGQGAPECEPLPGAPERKYEMNISFEEMEYAPTTGVMELRDKVATYYNHLYRQGKESQYKAENVCIVPGGRAGITRIMAALGETQVGFFNPDYTAYEQALGLFMRLTPSVYVHKDVNKPIMDPAEFEFQTVGRGVGTVLLSNPCNPTGQSIEGEDLEKYVEISRDHNVAMIMDEFYSHYYYDGDAVSPADGGADDDSNWPKTVSSCKYIDNVNKDPILIVNGLTKNWRCPGLRLCWVVAPAPIVELLGAAGSFLDGGANAPSQYLALPLMELDFIRRDTWALQRHFKKKRDYFLKELADLGINVQWQPNATFYVWADLSSLPKPLNDSLVFLNECTKHKIICVPGVFFDVNPRGIRQIAKSRCNQNVRFSYGPPMQNLVVGIKNLKEIIRKFEISPMRASLYVKDMAISSLTDTSVGGLRKTFASDNQLMIDEINASLKE